MVASYLLDAGERNHSLDQLSLRYLDHPMIPISDLIGKGRQQKRMDEVEVEKVVVYACEDADVALRLSQLLEPRLHDEGLWDLYEKLERPLIRVLAELEYNGIRVDRERLAQLSEEYGTRLAAIEEQIFELAGRTFNIGSPLQLREVLFDELNLPVLRKTKTGASTDQSVLEQLARDHPLPGLLIEHRKLAKLKSTYLDALPLMVDPGTGRIHASFHQAVAATGRLSSSDPNLQNIPVRTEEGRQIRQAFIPGEKHWQLLTADYSQIELRILAHLSGDATLRQAFREDEDIHAFVAGQVYGVPPTQVTPEMRRTAKMVNFGVIYGLSPFGLASRLGIPQEEAAVFIDSYFARYPGVEDFLTKILDQGSRNGYVSTILGRRRSISGIRSVPSRQRNLPERTAINTVIQGSAADLIKQAMIQIHCRLSTENFSSKMLLQIHDELVFEMPPEERDPLARLVTEEMTGALTLDVALKVDMAAGPNWLDVEPLVSVGPEG
jgi:DNA polymerase-1